MVCVKANILQFWTLLRLMRVSPHSMRRNTHQAQQRPKLKYVRFNAYHVGDSFADSVSFTSKVFVQGDESLAWTTQGKVIHVKQLDRVNFLDSGQHVHFEQLKPHHSGATEYLRSP